MFKGTKKNKIKCVKKAGEKRRKELRREIDRERSCGNNLGVICRILQHMKLHSSTQNAQIVLDMIPS